MNKNITANTIRNYNNNIYAELIKYYNFLLEKYNLNKKWNHFMIYDLYHRNEDTELIAESRLYNRMITISDCYSDPKSVKFNTDDAIIEEIDQRIYFSYQAFYEIIISCLMDRNAALETMKFTLKHEIGHILHNRTYIGKPIGEWYNKNEKYLVDEKSKLLKLRKNASMKSRLEWILLYNKLSEEAYANEQVGITEEDIIMDFYRTNGF